MVAHLLMSGSSKRTLLAALRFFFSLLGCVAREASQWVDIATAVSGVCTTIDVRRVYVL